MLHEWRIHSSFLGVAALSEKIKIIIRTKTDMLFTSNDILKLNTYQRFLESTINYVLYWRNEQIMLEWSPSPKLSPKL